MWLEYNTVDRYEILHAFWSTMAEQLLQEHGTEIALELFEFQPPDIKAILHLPGSSERMEGFSSEEEDEKGEEEEQHESSLAEPSAGLIVRLITMVLRIVLFVIRMALTGIANTVGLVVGIMWGLCSIGVKIWGATWDLW